MTTNINHIIDVIANLVPKKEFLESGSKDELTKRSKSFIESQITVLNLILRQLQFGYSLARIYSIFDSYNNSIQCGIVEFFDSIKNINRLSMG